jgi:hypothetical protein
MKRDPRLPRVRGGQFGIKTHSIMDRISSASPFFRLGTHRAPHGDAYLNDVGKFDMRKFNSLQLSGRCWKSTPGPGAYRTPYSLNRALSADIVSSSRTICRRSPSAIMFGPSSRAKSDPDSPGPVDYSPACGYTTVC